MMFASRLHLGDAASEAEALSSGLDTSGPDIDAVAAVIQSAGAAAGATASDERLVSEPALLQEIVAFGNLLGGQARSALELAKAIFQDARATFDVSAHTDEDTDQFLKGIAASQARLDRSRAAVALMRRAQDLLARFQSLLDQQIAVLQASPGFPMTEDMRRDFQTALQGVDAAFGQLKADAAAQKFQVPVGPTGRAPTPTRTSGLSTFLIVVGALGLVGAGYAVYRVWLAREMGTRRIYRRAGADEDELAARRRKRALERRRR